MLIAMLFIIALNRKSSKYPSVVGWINKLWYVYIIDYYREMRVNIMHIITHTLKYGYFINIMLSIRSHMKKSICHTIHSYTLLKLFYSVKLGWWLPLVE